MHIGPASKAEIGLIRKLGQRKYRGKLNKFLAEGKKVILELAQADMHGELLICGEEKENLNLPMPTRKMEEGELAKLSGLTTSPGYLAVFAIPDQGSYNPKKPSLILDGVTDPGNAGTLIRLADWYGIEQVVFTGNAVDPYNLKTVQASMGSLARVKIFGLDIQEVFGTLKGGMSTIAVADLGGGPLAQLNEEILHLVIGSESHGPNAEWKKGSAKTVSIQRAQGRKTESLNAGVSAGILLQAWKGIA